MSDLIQVGGAERPTKKVELSDLPGAWVIVHVKLNVGETRALQKAVASLDGYEKTLHYTLKAIKDWNLADQGTKLPFTIESLSLISEDDILNLAAAARGMTKDELEKMAKDNLGVKKN